MSDALQKRIREWFTLPIEGHGLYARYCDAEEILTEVLAVLDKGEQSPRCDAFDPSLVALGDATGWRDPLPRCTLERDHPSGWHSSEDAEGRIVAQWRGRATPPSSTRGSPMGEILSVEEAERAALHERCAQLWESHEALRARLAEVEAERDNLAMFHRDWYANDLPEMQRLAMWLDPDPDLPLPSLHNLVSGAMEREAEVAARLAEVEHERVDWHQAYESADDRAKVAVMRAEAAEARLVEVEAEREAARSNVAHWSAEWSTRLRAAEARLAEVEQALRFYADPANHAWPSPDQAWSNVDADNGDIARAVLDKGEPK